MSVNWLRTVFRNSFVLLNVVITAFTLSVCSHITLLHVASCNANCKQKKTELLARFKYNVSSKGAVKQTVSYFKELKLNFHSTRESWFSTFRKKKKFRRLKNRYSDWPNVIQGRREPTTMEFRRSFFVVNTEQCQTSDRFVFPPRSEI